MWWVHAFLKARTERKQGADSGLMVAGHSSICMVPTVVKDLGCAQDA